MFKGKWPIYQRRKSGYLVQDLVTRLVFSKIDDSSICSSVSFKCQENATFLLKVNSLASARDLVVDGNGKWGSSSCVTTLVKYSKEGTANIVGKNCKTFDYKVKCNYYKHQHTTSFHRVTYTLQGRDGTSFPIALMQYYFDGEVVPVSVQPHGSKKHDNEPHERTKASVINAQQVSIVLRTPYKKEMAPHSQWH